MNELSKKVVKRALRLVGIVAAAASSATLVSKASDGKTRKKAMDVLIKENNRGKKK